MLLAEDRVSEATFSGMWDQPGRLSPCKIQRGATGHKHLRSKQLALMHRPSYHHSVSLGPGLSHRRSHHPRRRRPVRGTKGRRSMRATREGRQVDAVDCAARANARDHPSRDSLSSRWSCSWDGSGPSTRVSDTPVGARRAGGCTIASVIAPRALALRTETVGRNATVDSSAVDSRVRSDAVGERTSRLTRHLRDRVMVLASFEGDGTNTAAAACRALGGSAGSYPSRFAAGTIDCVSASRADTRQSAF